MTGTAREGQTRSRQQFQHTVLDAFETYGRHFELREADNPRLMEQVFALRYQIYCVEKGYERPVDSAAQAESDAWDQRARHLVLLHRESGVAIATARLVRPHATDPEQPFPIETHSGLSRAGIGRNSFLLPRDAVGEVSRFAISKLIRSRLMHCCPVSGGANADRTLGGWVTLNLIKGLVELSRNEGINHWYTLMEAGFIRLFARLGLFFEALGEPIDFKGRRYLSVESVDGLMSGMKRAQPALYEALWGVVASYHATGAKSVIRVEASSGRGDTASAIAAGPSAMTKITL